MRRTLPRLGILIVLLFSFLGFLAMGYHPGAEDDAVYLSAVKADLNPALFPHDAAFFKLQMHASVFDSWMAAFVHSTGFSVAWSEFLWQFVSLFLILWAAWTIICQLFWETRARIGGIALLAAMFTLPVAGTALYIADQYLHPRNLATALILFAVSRILTGKRWQAVPLLSVALVLHPIMAALGISFCFFLCVITFEPLQEQIRMWREREVPETEAVATPVAAILPFGWLFSPMSPTWRDAIGSRHSFQLYNWAWYEWLGAVAPLLIFWYVSRFARRQGNILLARFALAVLFYGVFQQIVAMIILGPHMPAGLSALEPMRFLQLVYVFMTLLGGAYLGKCLLKSSVWRWAVFLVVANGGMFLAQRELFASTEHIELPGAGCSNAWLQAFAWIRNNTPQDAYFALDPNYMAAPGEDYHSFRAVAERSVLADAIKDTSVISKVPELGTVWQRQVQARTGWNRFELADFERLKLEFGVNWVIVSYSQPTGLSCPWHNDQLAVCRVP